MRKTIIFPVNETSLEFLVENLEKIEYIIIIFKVMLVEYLNNILNKTDAEIIINESYSLYDHKKRFFNNDLYKIIHTFSNPKLELLRILSFSTKTYFIAWSIIGNPHDLAREKIIKIKKRYLIFPKAIFLFRNIYYNLRLKKISLKGHYYGANYIDFLLLRTEGISQSIINYFNLDKEKIKFYSTKNTNKITDKQFQVAFFLDSRLVDEFNVLSNFIINFTLRNININICIKPHPKNSSQDYQFLEGYKNIQIMRSNNNFQLNRKIIIESKVQISALSTVLYDFKDLNSNYFIFLNNRNNNRNINYVNREVPKSRIFYDVKELDKIIFSDVVKERLLTKRYLNSYFTDD